MDGGWVLSASKTYTSVLLIISTGADIMSKGKENIVSCKTQIINSCVCVYCICVCVCVYTACVCVCVCCVCVCILYMCTYMYIIMYKIKYIHWLTTINDSEKEFYDARRHLFVVADLGSDYC